MACHSCADCFDHISLVCWTNFLLLSTVSMMYIKLHPLVDGDNKLEHCRALSSDDDDSFCEAESDGSKDCPGREPSASSADLHSSGYSSVQSVSPSSTCSSSSLVTHTFRTFTTSLGTPSAKAQPGFRLLVPMQRPWGTSTRQVKRKNVAAHSVSEVEREDEDLEEDFSAGTGFLSLWVSTTTCCSQTTCSVSNLQNF